MQHFRNLNKEEKLAHAYFYAKDKVKKSGYVHEIDIQESTYFDSINESQFIQETAWVILNTGMKEKVIRNLWQEISLCFYNWESFKIIIDNSDKCIPKALKIFNYPQKIKSIIECTLIVDNIGFGNFKNKIMLNGVDQLEILPFIGKVTKYHLAKNLGLNFSKPDRHLQRISELLNFKNVHEMCSLISSTTYDRESTIDLVIWRYATLFPDYVNKIKLHFES